MDRRKKIEQLDKLFIELRNITSERSKERILWHSDGKGINFDNISVLNRKAQNKKDEILALRGLLNRYKKYRASTTLLTLLSM